jgi:hypothetical protein
MKPGLALLPFCLIFSAASAAEFPVAWRGDYALLIDAETTTCTQGDYAKHENDGISHVGIRNFKSWESACDLISFKQKDETAFAKLECSGEGSNWKEASIMRSIVIRGRAVLIFADTKTNRISLFEKCAEARK